MDCHWADLLREISGRLHDAVDSTVRLPWKPQCPALLPWLLARVRRSVFPCSQLHSIFSNATW
ncbi:hypothetical protein E2562_036330 [Oryza meyeriana var. granulata]|uniref:Uncharacterized protein n=1 Tax=Oryza meyeriana var. granulata TaxID=110450 RepID=A0A6G1DSJ4_9ORYZ|nr:hypothetical protein E2562_036330 [Oryza meyeriana var. granulata]